MIRVLFIRFGSIGNAMVAIPAVRAVRKEMPDAFLALLCNPETYDLWKDCPWLDKVIVYDQKGKHKSLGGYFSLISELRGIKFTHSIHFRRFLRSELIGFLSGAKERIGFDPDGFSLLTKKIPYHEDQPIAEQTLLLTRPLGVKSTDANLEYWPAAPSEKIKNIFAGPSKLKVVLSPYARTWAERRWWRFPELAQRLAKERNAEVVVVGASDELKIARKEFKDVVPEDRLAFGLSLPELASLIKSAGLFIGQDAGPVHLAVAVATPSIIIYSPAPDRKKIFEKWKPAGEKFVAMLPPKDCNDCSDHPCAQEKLTQCLDQISADQVLEKISKLRP
jgi:heptosyltransferase II